jgi:hypothetical protein
LDSVEGAHATGTVRLGIDARDGGPGDLAPPDDGPVGRDAGPVDGAPLADLPGPFIACPAGALFCDDFEGSVAWSGQGGNRVDSDGGAGDGVAETTAQSHSPTHSTLFTITGVGDSLYKRATVAPAPSSLFVRMFVYTSAVPASGTTWLRLYNYIQGSNHYVALQFLDGGALSIDYAGGRAQSNTQMPTGSWQCLVLGFSSSTVTLYLGQSQAAMATSLSFLFASPPDSADVGLISVPNAPAQLYVDDVTITSAYLPCP